MLESRYRFSHDAPVWCMGLKFLLAVIDMCCRAYDLQKGSCASNLIVKR